MNIKKRTFDIIFIIISALVLIAVIMLDLSGKYMGFALIPLIIAYQLGRYAERKFKD